MSIEGDQSQKQGSTPGGLQHELPVIRKGRPSPNRNSHNLTLNVPLPVHEVMTGMADERLVPTTELLRRAYETFRILDSVVTDHPEASIMLDKDGPRLPITLFTQLGKDVW